MCVGRVTRNFETAQPVTFNRAPPGKQRANNFFLNFGGKPPRGERRVRYSDEFVWSDIGALEWILKSGTEYNGEENASRNEPKQISFSSRQRRVDNTQREGRRAELFSWCYR